VDELVSLHSLLYSHNLDGGVDKIWWVPDRKGKYAVKSFYKVLISRECSPFLGRVFGILKPRLEWCSSFGQQLLARFSRLII
jgi:hypothetical protein